MVGYWILVESGGEVVGGKVEDGDGDRRGWVARGSRRLGLGEADRWMCWPGERPILVAGNRGSRLLPDMAQRATTGNSTYPFIFPVA